MHSRNIDFFAVGAIALVLAAVSNVPRIRPFDPIGPVRLENAVTVSSNRFQQRMDSQVKCFQQHMDLTGRRMDQHMRAVDDRMRAVDERFRALDSRLSHLFQ
jgi:hypothetical protein